MSHDKHRNDQASRRLRGPRGSAGQEMGTHIVGERGMCTCGGCEIVVGADGARKSRRIAQRTRVVQL